MSSAILNIVREEQRLQAEAKKKRRPGSVKGLENDVDIPDPSNLQQDRQFMFSGLPLPRRQLGHVLAVIGPFRLLFTLTQPRQN